ncbi:expressed unknown protein [Seminavis robusta]|uniref:Uncharacterized protein n=1 Tax=Seminavis robusta TaxID=568900 RepID=A0A9N8EPT5_9STRA|nr:expressed unknown protein [Seminavis robusta]|eukprot:Sro1395_g269100.1 n/a (219) ;mRNA; f:24243-24993
MVSSGRSSPAVVVRPQWTKTGSWRKYIRTHSNRKLQVDLDLTQERHVHFDTESNRVEEVTQEEQSVMDARWYKKSDYEVFERDRQLTALQYRAIKKKGAPFIEREHSVRGLEHLLDAPSTDNSNAAATVTSKGKVERTSGRSEHSQRVLQEQSRQKSASVYPNDAMLREVACKSSRESRQRSAERGEADALAGYVTSSRALQRKVGGVMHTISRSMQP